MHLSFRTKLFGVVVPAIVLLLGLGWVLTNDRLNTAAEAERARVEAQVAETAMQLRDEFQNEAREAAYAVNSPADGRALLAAQQRTTDALITKLRAEIVGLPADAKDARVVNLTDLSMASDVQTARTRVADAREGDLEAALEIYDVLDERAAAMSAALTNVGGSKELANQSAELQSYLLAKGDYGRQLVFLGAHLNGKPVPEFEGAELHELEEVAHRAFERLRLTASQATVEELAPFFLARATIDGHTDQFVGSSGGTAAPGLSLAEWRRLSNESMKQLDESEDAVFIAYVTQAADAEKAASRAAKVFGFLTLFGILVVTAGAYLIGRSLSRRLSSITKAAHEIAVDRLPEVLESLRNPTAEAIARAVPQIETTSSDEVGRLAGDFNKVLKTAIETSVEHSQRRAATLTNLLINLGRRNQALIDRQLELIDELESNQQDQTVLAGLFKLDHMVTRQRRNAESLLVLAGSRRSRGWSDALPISDVLRGSISEVGQMERIQLEIQPGNDLFFSGTHAVDMSHLVAELLENATLYSSPATTVTLRVQRSASQFRVWVIDSGVGMTDEELEAANHRVLDPPDIDEITTDQVGFQVVGRLAQRIGARVRLQSNPAGGVAASIDLPMSVFEAMPDAPPRRRGDTAAAAASEPMRVALPDDIQWADDLIGNMGNHPLTIDIIPEPAIDTHPLPRRLAATLGVENTGSISPGQLVRVDVPLEVGATTLPRRNGAPNGNDNGQFPADAAASAADTTVAEPAAPALVRRKPNGGASPSAAIAAAEGAFLRLPSGGSKREGNDAAAARRRRLLSDFSRGVEEGRNDVDTRKGSDQ